MSKYQTHFSEQGKATCLRLAADGFVDELRDVLLTRLFDEFSACSSREEMEAVKAKLDVSNTVLNTLIEGKH